MKSRNAILVSTLLVFGLAALILFLTIPEERLDSSVFWLAFSFAIPVNFIAMASLTVWAFGKSGSQFVKLPTALYISGGFAAALLVIGFAFMYLDVTKTTWPIIIFVGLTVAYVILTVYAVLGTGYMASVEKQVAEKRLFIKMLEADVLDCVAKSTDPATQAALRAFADKIRFSDPMSHASLSAIENDISSLVFEISRDLSEISESDGKQVSDAPRTDVIAKIRRAEAMLASRNNRCIMLK